MGVRARLLSSEQKARYKLVTLYVPRCMHALPNPDCLDFTQREEEMMFEIAEEVFLNYFRPANSNKMADGKGAVSASYLGHEIAHMMRDNLDGKSQHRFIELSAHDTTVCALAARMGVDIQHPWFTGHWLFELHQRGNEEPFVRCFYNPNPTKHDELELVARKIPFEGETEFHKWNSLPEGEIPFNAFAEALIVAELSDSSKLLQGLHCYLNGSTNGGDDKALLHEALKQGLTPERVEAALSKVSEEHKAKWAEIFKVSDLTHEGSIDKGELVAAFRKLGLYVDPEDIAGVLSLYDLQKNGTLELNEFLLLCASVTGALGGEIYDDQDDDDDADEI